MKQTTITLAAIALLLTACQQADEPQPAPRHPVALQLTSGIAATVTRAYDATWQNGDKIGVFTTEADTKNTTKSGTVDDANVLYTTTGTSSFTSASPIYLPIDGSDVDVYAYYPYNNDVKTKGYLDILIHASQEASSQKSYDVMKACALSSTSTIDMDHSSVALQFSHCLSKIVIRIKLATGYAERDLDGITAKLTGQPTTATFTPLTQTLAIPSSWDPSEITPAALTSTDDDWGDSDVKYAFRAIILPNTTAGRDGSNNNNAPKSGRQIAVTVGDIAYTYSIAATQDFQPGQQTVYELTLAPEDITVTATISDWTKPASITTTDPLYPDL